MATKKTPVKTQSSTKAATQPPKDDACPEIHSPAEAPQKEMQAPEQQPLPLPQDDAQEPSLEEQVVLLRACLERLATLTGNGNILKDYGFAQWKAPKRLPVDER